MPEDNDFFEEDINAETREIFMSSLGKIWTGVRDMQQLYMKTHPEDTEVVPILDWLDMIRQEQLTFGLMLKIQDIQSRLIETTRVVNESVIKQRG